MKRTYTLGIASVMMAFALVSCGGSDPVVQEDEVVINIPCSGPEYFTDDEAFRANAFGESIDMMTAKRKAMSNAKAQLAGDIESVMKLVGDNYVMSRELNNREEVLERFEENARTVVNQTLRGIRQICEVNTKVKQDGDQDLYRYYVAIELSAENLAQSYYQSLSDDEVVKIDYNYERFKETFEEEMENYRSNR
ncbi:hypothetical protein [Phaeocystidibacter luteus]|uniref:LPP20 lipoprotein n=1 Tax=Phaeocystidibacter luteus TaxID=911197 RepID=A0A6N6REN5_9FLAO|nr:hypothetical protein [Phaeocystidibacter luteus]KAB2808657.1 hypothetical protein F8C67_10245 [Phaeocystidibacter luteus]